MFGSPSSWSLSVKLQTQPGLRSDAGWLSIRAGVPDGPSLEDLKKTLQGMRRRHAAAMADDAYDFR